MFSNKTLKIAIIVLAVIIMPSVVFAVPQFPHSFYGSVTINNSPAAAGTVIIAKVNGVEKGRITTIEAGKYGGPGAYDPKLLVQGDDLQAGNTISFTVSGTPASQTVLFSAGTVANQNLTFVNTVNTGANVSLDSANEGEADMPVGATNLILTDTTVLDLSSSKTSQSSTNVSVGGNVVTLTQAVILQSGVDGQPVILTNSNLANISASIPDGTKIQGPAGWDGKITPPVAGTPSGNAPAGFSVGSTVISVGSPNGTLVFDNPVTILLSGVTGTVGYRPSGSNTWVQITTVCGGSYTTPNPTAFPGECAISNGTDTKIVTYHFTSFGSLAVVSSGGNNSGGGGGGSISTPTPTPTPTRTPTPTPASLSSAAQKVDTNHDGKIDVLDFNSLMINWGSTSVNNLADFNVDGKVDILDFNLLMIHWS